MRTILFDCDGTLVDSEIIAMGVAIDILADAVQEKNPDVVIDRASLVQEFSGWHFDKMIPEMAQRYDVYLDARSLEGKKIPQTLAALAEVRACPWILNFLTRNQRPVALVTSSEFERVNPCLEKTGLDAIFPEDRKFSAHDSMPERIYKPDPAIYIFALKRLGLEPIQTVAVEDSPSGVKAAVAAGIDTIGYVGASHIPFERKSEAAERLLGLGAKIVISDFRDLENAILWVENPAFQPVFIKEVFTPGQLPPPPGQPQPLAFGYSIK